MTIGELKTETLKLMLPQTRNISAADLDGLAHEEEYAEYLNGFIPALNRCLADITAKKVLEEKAYVITQADITPLGADGAFIDLATVPSFGRINRLTRKDKRGYDGNAEYVLEGHLLIILNYDPEAAYTVIYDARLARVAQTAANGDEIDVPDEAAALIPLFIKGELYREDEPAEAAEARNLYEQGMIQLYGMQSRPRQAEVYKTYEV